MIPKIALTIAGSDPGGGAGLQVDLKIFAALGVYGYSAVTAITAQNSTRIDRIDLVAPAMVAAQIAAVAAERKPDAIKTGALINAAIVEAVADTIEQLNLPAPVVDPVLIASSGVRLLDDAGELALRSRLIPIAIVVTPNIPEAEALSGITIRDADGMREAALAIHRIGARAVVIKGGHPFSGSSAFPATADDLFYDGKRFIVLEGKRIAEASIHGSGCIFSAAIAAHLARGDELELAIRAAKSVIESAIRNRVRLGHGRDVLGSI
ncbi:MAG: bifunctional hydroxymethylpyrimidine kinase/phosphomethylpyrimidine kinase [Candidatus Binataceae bacterium]|nr:bifunctional hydroxymethylpyrimidine kinase/phosphomethylpyrimidine kinase [Candidatus Binataceae bacterium]